jgi:hypothetical protein
MITAAVINTTALIMPMTRDKIPSIRATIPKAYKPPCDGGHVDGLGPVGPSGGGLGGSVLGQAYLVVK